MGRKLTDKGWVVEERQERQQQQQQEAPETAKTESAKVKELRKALKEAEEIALNAEERALNFGSELGRLEAFIRENFPHEILLMPSDVVDVAIRLMQPNKTEPAPEPTE